MALGSNLRCGVLVQKVCNLRSLDVQLETVTNRLNGFLHSRLMLALTPGALITNIIIERRDQTCIC